MTGVTLAVDGLHPLYGPVVVLLALLLLGALLRWTFGDTGTMAGPNRAGEGHGLLVEVARAATAPEAAALRTRLAQAGVRATISRAADTGLAVLVFPLDEPAARDALSHDAVD